MMNMKEIKVRADLINSCEVNCVSFVEVSLLSYTRFAQYPHRSYEKILKLYMPYYKLLQKRASSDTNEALDAQCVLCKIQHPQFVLRLYFLEEVFKIITVTVYRRI